MKLKLIQLKTTIFRMVINILSSKLDFFEEVDFLPKDNYDGKLVLQEQLKSCNINNFSCTIGSLTPIRL